MSIETYFLFAFLVAFGGVLAVGLDEGDYPRATAMLVFAALWPMAVGLGLALIVRALGGALLRLIRKQGAA